MRIVDFLTIVLGASLTMLYVNSKPVYAYSTILLTDDIIRVKKRNDDTTIGYLEQCGPVTFPMAQRGVVNVLAFLDSSWPYSHRQAIMLKMLNDRLRRSGLPDTLFFVVNVDPSFLNLADNPEDDIEKEAWHGVSPEEIDHFSEIEKTTDSLKLSMSSDIKLIQDNEDLGIWKTLRGSRDQVLVIDRCGKLTYQVIVPWSILHFPYVKAAILSTYKDEPCGPCDIINNATESPYRNKSEGTASDLNTESSLTTHYYLQNNRKEKNISDTIDPSLQTERNIQIDENIKIVYDEVKNVVSSTSIYENSNWNTNEETSTASFVEIDIVNETTTNLNNLITTEINSSPIYEKEILDDFTTSASTNVISILSNDSHDTEQRISTDLISLDTNLKTTTENKLEDENKFSTLEQYFHQTEINDEGSSTNIYDSTESVTISATITSKEENLSLHVDEILTISDDLTMLQKNTTSKEDDVEFSGTNFDTPESFVDATTDENLDFSTSRNLRVREDSMVNEETRLLQDSSKENEEIKSVDIPFEFPIRIIMHAPHFHVDGDSTRMHEYMILKTGNSEHHNHLASRDATRLYGDLQDFHEKVDDTPNEDIEAKTWSMSNIIYNKDESPGLYGEVADFWRGMNSQENYDDEENTERPEEEQIAEETSPGFWNKPTKEYYENPSKTDNIDTVIPLSQSADDLVTVTKVTEKLQADAQTITTEAYAMNVEEFNAEEEETRNKLIDHYSKLLPWIYYVLDK